MKQNAEKKALEAVDRDDYRYGTYEYLTEKIMYNRTFDDPLAGDVLFSIFHANILEKYPRITKIVEAKSLFVNTSNFLRSCSCLIYLLTDKNLPVDKPFLLGARYVYNAVDHEGESNYYSFPFSIKEFSQSEDFELLATFLPHGFKFEPAKISNTVDTELMRLGDFVIPADKSIHERLYEEIVVKQWYKKDEMLTAINNVHEIEKKHVETLEALGENIIWDQPSKQMKIQSLIIY